MLEGCHKVDLVGSLSEVGTGCIHHPEVESKVEGTVDIAAEHCFKERFFFRTLFIPEFCKGFKDLVIFNAVILKKVAVEVMDPIVKAAVGEDGVGDQVSGGLADISLGGIECRESYHRVIVLIACN